MMKSCNLYIAPYCMELSGILPELAQVNAGEAS